MSELEQLKTEFQTRKDIVFSDRNVMRGILSDCLHGEKAKVNQLLAAFDGGVVERIVSEENPDDFFIQRMIMELESSYGYPRDTCGWIVNCWLFLICDRKMPTTTKTTTAIPKTTQSSSDASNTNNETATNYSDILETAKNYILVDEKRDYKKAEQILNTILSNLKKEDNLSVQGNFYMGLIFDKQGDFNQAIKYYKIAADRDHDNAQNNLGVLYHDGKGVPVNREKAEYWFQQAKSNGSRTAEKNLEALLKSSKEQKANRIAMVFCLIGGVITGLLFLIYGLFCMPESIFWRYVIMLISCCLSIFCLRTLWKYQKNSNI